MIQQSHSQAYIWKKAYFEKIRATQCSEQNYLLQSRYGNNLNVHQQRNNNEYVVYIYSGILLSHKEDLQSFPFYCFPLFLCIVHLRRPSHLSDILWSPSFSWVYLSHSPLSFTSLLSSAICKASSDNHFAFLYFFFFGMVLVTASYTMFRTSIHSSSSVLDGLAQHGLQLHRVTQEGWE